MASVNMNLGHTGGSSFYTRIYSRLYAFTRMVFQYTFPDHAYKRLISQKWREEEAELALLPTLAEPKREAIDVGANVGHYTLALSKIVKHVYSFEPHPQLAYILKRSMPSNVSVHEEAVSDRLGAAVLTVPTFDRPVEGLGSLSSLDAFFPDARSLQRFRVRQTFLDTLADRDIGFVKIDIEGHEICALRGASKLIQAQRPVCLVEIEERHRAGSIEEVTRYFAEFQYDCFFISLGKLLPIADFLSSMQDISLIVNEVPRKHSRYINNFLFLPAERSPNLSDRLRLSLSESIGSA